MNMGEPPQFTQQMLEQMLAEAVGQVGKSAQRKAVAIHLAKHFSETTAQVVVAFAMSLLHAVLQLGTAVAPLSAWLAMLLAGDLYNAGVPVPASLLGFWSWLGIVSILMAGNAIHRLTFREVKRQQMPTPSSMTVTWKDEESD